MIAASIWRHRNLILVLAKRDVATRYRGSFLGVAWAVAGPLILLTIYTFVFTGVFRAQWRPGAPSEPGTLYALMLFCGLVPFGIVADTVSRSPVLILARPDLVTRSMFPLVVLPVAASVAVIFQHMVGFGVLLLGVAVFQGSVPITVVVLPLLLAVLLLWTLAAAFFLSALGVFVRDLQQVVGLLILALMFLSAVFYPAESVPDRWRFLVEWNPLALLIENCRRVAIIGVWPSWWEITALAGTGGAVLIAAGWWFERTQSAFSDVM